MFNDDNLVVHKTEQSVQLMNQIVMTSDEFHRSCILKRALKPIAYSYWI